MMKKIKNFFFFHPKLARSYANFAKSQPYEHNDYKINLILKEKRWGWEEKKKVLDLVTKEDVELAGKKIFQKNFMEILMHGNILEKDGLQLAVKLEVKNFFFFFF
jgi:secreted Zn-dependent insulinase-like peptidase